MAPQTRGCGGNRVHGAHSHEVLVERVSGPPTKVRVLCPGMARCADCQRIRYTTAFVHTIVDGKTRYKCRMGCAS